MNVLLTCAGRRHYLVRYFREALHGRGTVLATDATLDAPALAAADGRFQVSPVSSPGYVEEILRICRENSVGLLVSLNDLELPVLAKASQRFEQAGVTAVVSAPHVIDLCFDKVLTPEFLNSIGVQTPRQYLSLEEAQAAIRRGDLSYPVVVKPRWGTGSIAIDYAENAEELVLAHALTQSRLKRSILASVSETDWERSVLIQEKLPGQEYGFDVVNDLQGRYVATFVKRKLAMRAGETDRAEVVAIPELEQLGARIGEKLGHLGNLDCDVFLTPDGPRVLELNPRFGGGYPFSHEAGANLPAALLAWSSGREPNPEWFRPKAGWRGSKCDVVVASQQPENARQRAG